MPKIEKNSIKKNFFMNVLLTLSTFIFPLITFPYVSRVLTPIGTGKVAMATSFIQYFVMFAMLGIPTYGVRAVAKVRDNREKLTKTVHELLIISGITSLIAYVILFACIPTIPKLAAEKPLYYLMSSTILLNCIGIEWMYRGLEQYTYITVRSIIFKFIALVAMFLFIHNQGDYIIYAATTIVASSLSYVLNFVNARKYIDMKWVGGYDFKPHFKAVAIFLAMAVATTVYTHLDTVMLGFMTTDTDVGYYNAAVKIKNVLVSIVTSLGVVLLPRASYYVETNRMKEFKIISAKALDFVMVAALPVTVYFIYFARQGIMLLSGEAYMGSIQPMQILMPTIIGPAFRSARRGRRPHPELPFDPEIRRQRCRHRYSGRGTRRSDLSDGRTLEARPSDAERDQLPEDPRRLRARAHRHVLGPGPGSSQLLHTRHFRTAVLRHLPRLSHPSERADRPGSTAFCQRETTLE